MRLQLPGNWQDFERICHMLWREIWSDANAQMHGRRGQPQHGVDVFGRPLYQTDYAGVQCKDKDGRLGASLSKSEIDAECQKAKQFVPYIRAFTIATTCPRDEDLQQHARRLNVAEQLPFSVNVWSWDDIEQEVLSRPAILSRFFRDEECTHQYPASLSLSPYSPRDQFYAFFTRPTIGRALAPRLRDFLVPMVYELSDNCFLHGRGTRYSIECTDNAIVLSDNGVEFNPLLQLDASKMSRSGNIGSFVVASFLDEFQGECAVRYSRVAVGGTLENRLEIRFTSPLHSLGLHEVLDVPVDMTLAYGRGAAERLASAIAIPRGTSELILTITEINNISAFVEFLEVMLRRLPSCLTLTISLPRTKLLERAEEWLLRTFDDNRLKIRMR